LHQRGDALWLTLDHARRMGPYSLLLLLLLLLMMILLLRMMMM
jgi:hypothetical protein